MEGYHKSVLTKKVLDFLNIKKGNWYLDLTLGDGGHSLEILKLGGKVVGIDVDPEAFKRAKDRLHSYSEQDYVLVKGNFRDIDNLIGQTELADQKFAGAIFDLGVSSLQLETPRRGFSFAKLGPLDMRMDPLLEVSALDLIGGLNEGELNKLFYKLGEEKFSRALADAVVGARQIRPITTTLELARIIEKAGGRRDLPAGRQGKIHPATRVFQALRIAVNDELDALKTGLDKVKEKIEKNGHIVVISFHSLEDRIAKNTFREWADFGLGQVLTKKPITSSREEVKDNPRSRSAKMRIFKIL